MAFEKDLTYHADLRVIICKVHGQGLQPRPQSIIRHLRGEGHGFRGSVLRDVMSHVGKLRLSPIEELLQGRRSQILEVPIRHLKIVAGYFCIICQHLTSSLELMQRHASTEHGRHRQGPILWESCELQTIFSETKYRRYFRVGCLSVSRTDAYHHQASDIQVLRPTTCAYSWQRLEPTGPCSPGPERPLRLLHPYAALASEHVYCLTIDTLDHLFKSDAFRSASDPLFDSRSVDSSFNLRTVFPECETDSLFMTALVYSVVQSWNRGRPSTEGDLLQRITIALLNEKLSSASSAPASSMVGTIMVLKNTAAQHLDREAHEIHARGLKALLEISGKDFMTASARRALFWQDLVGALFLETERCVDTKDIFAAMDWQQRSETIPTGFLAYKDELPNELLGCIADTNELLSLSLKTLDTSSHIRYAHLDSMQASIESRLVNIRKLCKDTGGIVELIWFGIFIRCYCCYMDVWNNSLIPCTLADRLMDRLIATFTGTEPLRAWRSCLCLLLWLFLCTASAVEMDQGHVDDLQDKQKHLVNLVKQLIQNLPIDDVHVSIAQSTTNYILDEKTQNCGQEVLRTMLQTDLSTPRDLYS